MPSINRSEFSRALVKLFGFRGSPEATGETSILPVVVLDQLSPVVAYETWMAQLNQVASIGNVSQLALQNISDRGSVVVVDRVLVKPGAVMDLWIGVVNQYGNATTGSNTVQRTDAQHTMTNSFSPVFENSVALVSATPAGGIGIRIAAEIDARVREFVGPFTLGSGQSLVITGNLANTALDCTFFGRFYAAA